VINYYINIYSKIQQRYKNQSDYQKKFALALTLLRDNINDSEIELILNEAHEDVRKSNSFIDIKDTNLDRHINKILLNATIVEDYIIDALCKRGFKDNIKNFWYNDIFASIEQFRIDLILNYNVDEYYLETKDNRKIDMYV
jgi:hypothetical protein